MFNQYDANTGRGKVDAQVLAAHATGVENIKNILEFGFKRPTKTNTYNKLQGDNSYVEGQQYAIDQWMFQPDQFKALGDGLFLTTSWLKMDQYTTPFDYTNAELKKVLQEAQEKIRNHSVETGDKTEAMKDTTAGPDGCPVQRLKQFYQKIRYFLDTASADFLATTVGANFRLDLLANESETGGNDTFRKVKYATSTKVIRDPRFGFVTKASVPQFRTLLAGVGDVHAATPLGKTAPPVKVPMKTWVKAYNNWVHKTVKKLTDIQEKVDAAVLKGTEPMMRRDGVIAATSTATGVVNLQERTFLGKQHGGNSVEHLHQVCEISHPTEAELPMIPEKIYTHKNPFSDEETRKNVETAARKWTERLDTLENLKLEKDAHGVTYISTTWSDKNQYQTVLKDNPELKHRLMRLPEGSTTVEDEETLDPRLTADYWYASNPLRKGEHDAKVSPFAPFGPHQEELNIGSPEKAKPCWMVEYKMVTKREYNDLLLGKGKEGAASGEEIANLFNGGDEDEMKYKIEELTRDNWGSSGVSSGSASIAAQYIGRMVENRDTPFTPMELPQYDEQVKNMSEGAGDRLVINTNMYLAGADRDVKSIGVLAKPNPQELDPLKGTPRDFETVTLVPFVVRIFRVVDAKDSRPVCLADADKNVLDDLTASPGFGSLFKAQKEFSEGQRKSIQVFAAHGTGVENIHGILREGFKKGGKARPMLGHGEKKRLQQWEFQPDQFLTLGAGLYLTTSWSKVDQYAAPFDTQNKDLTSLLLEANKAGAGSYEWTALKKYQQKVRYMLNTIAGNSKALDTLAHAGYVAPSAEGTEFTRGVQYKASTKAVRDSRFAFVAEAELSNPVFTLLAGVGDLHGKRVPMVVWMKAYNQWFDNKVKELTSRIDGEQAGKGAKLEDIIEAGLAGINLEEKDSHPDCASASGSAV
ncbi:unnamed protein product [Amoebophrya sp. A25]|nr:unnamed protein product [Amoebophrya sp. A25]|eukprot:GSA25T00024884001.1